MKFIFKSFLAAFIFTGFFTVNGQAFQPVGSGINPNQDNVYAVDKYTDGSDVYFGYTTYNQGGAPTNFESFISKWNGSLWVHYPKLPAQGISALAVFNGDLYAAGGINSFSSSHNIYRFDGSNWNQVFPGLTGMVADMIEFNGHLVFAGTFTETSTGSRNVVGFDGTTAVGYPPLSVTDSLSDINVINNELWITGTIWQNVTSPGTASVRKLDALASAWVAPATKGTGLYGRGVFGLNSKVYMTSWNGLYEIRNDSAVFIQSGYYQDYEQFDNKLYLSGNRLHIFDGNTVSTIANSPQNISTIAANSNSLYGFFGDSIFNGIRHNHVFQISASQFGILSGQAFIDNNSDCQFTASTDQTGGNMKLSAQGPSPATVITDRYGLYNVALVPGTYNFTGITNLSPMNKYLIPDPNCGNPSNVTVQANQSTTADFALTHDGTIDALTEFHSYFSQRARHGFKEYYRVKLKNPGASISGNIDIQVTLPSTITLLNTSPAASSSNGNVHTFTFNGVGEREEKIINIEVRINTSTNSVGDQLCFYSELLGVQNDALLANNKDTMCLNVVAACDPNDKRANIQESLPGLKKLDYHIRFQNTGNDTAYNVVVVDTLEAYFDPSSIQMEDASHAYSLTIKEGNILVWTFNNILLPDSATNVQKSQGYILFNIEVDPTLPIGSIIDNDVEIYFDFQPPVHTNHAQTTIVQFVSLAENEEPLFEVYPNPANDILWVQVPGEKTMQFELISLTGKLLRVWDVNAGSKHQINLNDLPNGLYLLSTKGQTAKIQIQR